MGLPTIPYPGTAPIGYGPSGAPGVVVDPPPDGYGVFPIAQVAQGGSVRSAANQMAAAENNRDAINWLCWRLPDWISGGNYTAAFRGGVAVGNYLTIDRSWSSSSEVTLSVLGDTTGATCINVIAQGNSGTGITVTGGSVTVVSSLLTIGLTVVGGGGSPNGYPAAQLTGGGNAIGLVVGPGGTGTTAIQSDGWLALGGTPPTKTQDCGQDTYSGVHMAKAWGRIVTNGGSTTWDGVGVASVTATSAGYVVVMSHEMASINYSVQATTDQTQTQNVLAQVGSGQTLHLARTTTTFTIQLSAWNISGGGSSTLLNPTTSIDCNADFVVYGRQV